MKYPLLLATLAFAQADLERVYHFSNTSSPQSLNEIATVVRSMTDLRTVQVDATAQTLTFSGSPEQGALADWLMIHLDKRTSAIPSPPIFQAHFDQDPAVKMFYLRHTPTAQTLQELATVIRTLVQAPRVFVYHGESALVTRGTPDQVKLAEWLVEQLDRSAPPSAAEFRLSVTTPTVQGAADDAVRILPVPQASTVQQLQQIATQIRSQTKIRHLLTYSGLRVIGVRGTTAQLQQAQQIISQ